MDNEKIFDLITKMYADLKNEIGGVKNELGEVKTRLGNVEKTVIKIEDEHGKKLGALFDGYKQNSEKLEEIKKEVAKHEEVIIRRVK
ncbi:hypothetical protein OSC52_15475 [Clostridium pasteurianum]|uniref:hypothetical protein n=1 Tax=Clostridium pasteurianum TaxID=1501 RepID=UPI002260905A|nr:hypothetical protein [Clostridium pasteurianum]UZW13237.1 hypothetical protein OSC52_15475 [Clostridium pasteurianum]